MSFSDPWASVFASLENRPAQQDRPILPKWKTAWEKKFERKYQQAISSGSPITADMYDNYRQQYSDRFFITQPPSSPIRVPAEFEPSQAYLVAWMSNMGPAFDTMYTQMIIGAWGVVPVLLVYENATHRSWLENKLTSAGIAPAELTDTSKVIFWPHKLDGIWSRDFGPLSIVGPAPGSSTLSFVDYRYYHYRVYDDEIPTQLAQDWGINVFRPDLSFEGGNFMNTADGLCAATKGVLWYNPSLAQSAVEDMFESYLGCKKMIFPSPLDGEDTTHIDMFAKFSSDATVLVGEYSAAQDATNKTILDDNAALFAATTNGSGNPVQVVRIPMPNKGSSPYGAVWRTYTNSLALASATEKYLFVPVYSDETSQETSALAAYTAAFPGWVQVLIDSKEIIPMGGATHCITMQIPAGTLAKMESDPADLCGPTSVTCVPTNCGSVTEIGCCDGTKLVYCEDGQLHSEECQSNPSCGWDSSEGWYSCGTTGASDPSGNNPKLCAPPTDAGPPDMPVPSDGPSKDMGVDQAKDVSDPTKDVSDPTKDTGSADQSDQPAADLPTMLDQAPRLDQKVGKKDLRLDAAGPTEEDDGGCDCQVSASSAPSSGLIMLLLFAFVGRRRRSLRRPIRTPVE